MLAGSSIKKKRRGRSAGHFSSASLIYQVLMPIPDSPVCMGNGPAEIKTTSN